MEGLVIPLQRLHPDAQLPEYRTPGAAGMDLMALLDSPLELEPGARALVRTGLSVAIPSGYEGQIRPRSGLALRNGVSVLNSPGTIDSDYRGEIQVLLINLGEKPYKISHGDRIAQLVVCPVVRIGWEEREGLPDSARGAGGFGHTGR